MLPSLVITEYSNLHIQSPGAGLCWELKRKVLES